MLSTLAELLAPLSVSQFIDAIHAGKRLHVPSREPARAESLLPWHELERLIGTPGVLGEASLIKDGMTVPRQLYTSGTELDVRAFHDILGQGASVVIPEILRWVPQLERLAAAIERQLGVDTGINAYASFNKGGAFEPHWDRHDVLLVQVHGKKRWRVWRAPSKDPTRRSSEVAFAPSDPPELELELAPGDVFFLPRGEPHSAAVSSDASVHLTIGLNTFNGSDLIDHLRTAAGADAFVRADLPLTLRTSDSARAEYERELKRRLHALVEELSVAAVLRADDLGRAPARRVSLSSAPPSDDELLQLTLRRRVPLPSPADADPASVTIGGQSVTLAAASIAALAWLFDRDRASRKALTDALRSRFAAPAIDAALAELVHFGFLERLA